MQQPRNDSHTSLITTVAKSRQVQVMQSDDVCCRVFGRGEQRQWCAEKRILAGTAAKETRTKCRPNSIATSILSLRGLRANLYFLASCAPTRVQVASKGAVHVLEYVPIPLLHALDTAHSFDVPSVPGLRCISRLYSVSNTALISRSLPKPNVQNRKCRSRV